jgi:hypothetical protein
MKFGPSLVTVCAEETVAKIRTVVVEPVFNSAKTEQVSNK